MVARIICLSLCILSSSLFADNKPATPMLASAMNNQSSIQSRFDIDPSLNPDWMHYITAIDINTRVITIEDGSKWKAGYWYTTSVKKWAVGDNITISWYPDTYFLDTQIKNYSKHSIAWFEIAQSPQPNAFGFRYIEAVPNRMMLVLNDGTRVYANDSWMFNYFNKGDVVITLYGSGTGTTSHYSLWDMNSNYIAYDLSVEASR